MELEDEEKEDPNRREYDCRRAARSKKGQTEGGGGKQGQKVEKQCGVPSPEKEPRAHTRTHALARGRQAAGEEPRVTARVMLVAGGVATGV